MFRTRTALYYIVHAQNQSNVNEDVLIYLQDRFYKDQDSNDYIDRWIVTIDDHFQYGQKNRNGEGRWVALHDKGNKPYQHLFVVVTMQGKLAEHVKTLATHLGQEEIFGQVHKLGNSYVGDYLHHF